MHNETNSVSTLSAKIPDNTPSCHHIINGERSPGQLGACSRPHYRKLLSRWKVGARAFRLPDNLSERTTGSCTRLVTMRWYACGTRLKMHRRSRGLSTKPMKGLQVLIALYGACISPLVLVLTCLFRRPNHGYLLARILTFASTTQQTTHLLDSSLGHLAFLFVRSPSVLMGTRLLSHLSSFIGRCPPKYIVTAVT